MRFMRDTIAIIGSHPETRERFDYERTDCDVWLFNEAFAQAWSKQRADAVFQLHAPVIFRNPGNRNDKNHYELLKSGNTPTIYMQDKFDDVPMSERYPLDEICQKLLDGLRMNGKPNRYFTSSVAFAIAMGIYQGYKRIEIYGVEMETDTEYRYQRDGVTFWVGYALGRGIEVDITTKQILMAPLYGYEGDVRLPYEEFVNRIEVLTENAKLALEQYKRSKEDTDKALDEFLAQGKAPESEKVIEVIRNQVRMANQYGVADGARQENERYKKKADVMMAHAGGEFVFSRSEFEQAGQALLKEREKVLSLVNSFALKLGEVFDRLTKINYPDKRRRIKTKDFDPVLAQYIHESTKLGVLMGAAIENKRHLDKLTELIRAAGGTKSEEVMLEALQEAVA